MNRSPAHGNYDKSKIENIPKMDFEKSDSESTANYTRRPDDLEAGGEYYGESPLYIGIGTWSPLSSIENYEEFEKPLTGLESAALVCILEDAIDELVILKYVIGAPVDSSWDFRYTTPQDKYTRKLTPDRIFPEVDSKPVLTSTIKLQRERQRLENLLVRTMIALLDNGTYDPLTTAISDLRQEEEDEVQLIEELKDNLLYLKNLKEKVEEKRRLDDQEEKERDGLIYQLQDEMDDIILKCEVEEKFVDRWEKVRNAQNQWKLRDAENFYVNNIAEFAAKSKLEKRATQEMQLYIKINQYELEEQLEEWMARYDSEMEKRENRIIQLKYKRDQERQTRNQLQNLVKEIRDFVQSLEPKTEKTDFDKQTKEMKDWVIFRENRKIRTKATLLIQSWWRGIMVRKKLGPYKPKRRKKKGKQT